MTIGERIKQCRLENGMTLLEVAEQLGVKEATVQRYESGNIKNLKQETIGSLAIIFQVTPARLMGWEEKEPASSEPDELDIENEKLFKSLPESKKQEALNFLRFLQGK